MDCDDQPSPDEDTTHSLSLTDEETTQSLSLTDESSLQDAFILNYSEMEESSREEETEDDSIKRQEEIICNLGLTQYFEENKEISVQTAMIQSSSRRDSVSDIPWSVLLKLLMLDYRGRDDIVSDVIRNSLPTAEDVPTNHSGFMGGLDEIFSHLMKNTSSTAQSHLPHPMDVLTALILCSSNFLRQILCEKLYMCKLGIPLIIPTVLKKDCMFLLWSLRSTILEHRLPSGELCETSVAKCRIPIVSCLRLGTVSRSKSRFLNEIINDQNHPTFFHRDCQNGMYQRILSEGALEISWYYPVEENRDNDCLGKNVAILNLRGDGNSDRACKGKKFLCKVSNVVLVMIDVDELRNSDSVESLRLIVAHNIQLILMLTNKTKIELNEKIMESIRKCVETLKDHGFLNENIILDFNAESEKNLKALKSETVASIKRCLEREHKMMTIEECQDVAQNLKITVDENSLECSKGKQKASALLEMICRNGTNNLKAKNLPLQCRPWQEWAKLKTEEHRQELKGNVSIASYMDDISNKMRKLRQEQLQMFEEHHILHNVFMNFEPEANHQENLYLLQWLKLYLDEISRQIIPDLQKKCSEKWSNIRRCEDNEICSDLQNELERCEEELAESSFGIEHLFREVAQAYEAIQYLGNEEMKQQIHHLPRIMAELMLHGHSLEILDGDAAHIPLKWVQAVLTQLSEVTDNKKVFVLSVLGIQSSGKSTLLNTMFGLQFAVAAGRCTRGIFAQLLPIGAEFCGTKYDYILVLDTEGLRAAELGKAKLKHDNEIATLVIGLGDVTLVNVKGENVSELEDVLQIVIHALLKMRLVNRNLSLQPSCIFVHQNVSAQDASQRLRSGQQKFMEALDKVTEAAGKQEDSPEYTRFKQVINFDIDTDIWHISDLWKGDPPMAPANPGYSENVKKIKQILLNRVMLKRPFHLTIGKFCARLKDIWEGVLDQNFVFSFRNSLEMDAYNALESEQSDISWMLKSAEMKWFSGKRHVIENRENELGDLKMSLISECRSHLDQVYQQAREKLEHYFLNNEYQSLFEQWRVNAMLRLEDSYKRIVEKAVENINNEISKRQIKINEKNEMQTNITKIMDAAKTLAEKLQERNDMNTLLSEEQLKDSFNAKWIEWMNAIPQNVKENLDVQREIDHILDNTHTLEFTLLNKARKDRHHTIALDNFGYAIEQYVLEKTTKASVLHPFTGKASTAFEFLDELLENVTLLFSNEGTHITPKEYTEDLIGLVREIIQKMTASLKFKNKEEFEICIIMFTWQYACFVHHKFLEKKPKQDRSHEMVDDGIHPAFEEVLQQSFPKSATKVINQIRTRLTHQRSSRNFTVITKKHIKDRYIGKEEAREYIQERVNVLFDDVQSYIDEIESQCFRELYIEKIIRKIIEMENRFRGVITLTKTFRNELAVYLCQFSVPMFCDKHKAYLESMDQRLIYERDNYGPCFESFTNFYYRSTNEQALARVLAELLYSAIEKAVHVNLRTELVENIRNNVPELRLKPGFLRAVLRKLLEKDDFEDFYLYLTDRDTCLQQWLSHFIDQYLFASERDGLNRYTEIAFRNIERLISVICEMIVRPLPSSSEKSMDSWFEEFIQRVTDKLPLPLQDLLSLADGYEIVSLESFANQLSDKIRNCQEKLKATFRNHTPYHQKAVQENNIYKLIADECKGCAEKCPFCYAPCSLNTRGHTDSGIDHVALSHHPQACGAYVERISKKLVTESCEALVASDIRFRCNETNWESHHCKDYKKIFPDWKIQGDASVEATPYWKWFLVKYERQLAKRYGAERPDIPTSWKNITKEVALKALEH